MRHPLSKSQVKLPDYLRPGLRILFVGINPGLRSAAVGHHFAGYSNRFWKLLFESGLVPIALTHQDDWRLPEWGLGITNIVQRPTSGIDVLTREEYTAGKMQLAAIITEQRPHIVALLGVTMYRFLFPTPPARRRIRLGLQPNSLGGSPIFVLPNPSGRNAYYSYPVMLAAFQKLRKSIDAPP